MDIHHYCPHCQGKIKQALSLRQNINLFVYAFRIFGQTSKIKSAPYQIFLIKNFPASVYLTYLIVCLHSGVNGSAFNFYWFISLSTTDILT